MGSLPFSFGIDIPRLTPAAVIDILVVAAIIYEFILFIRGRRAGHIVVGLIILGAIYLTAVLLRLEMLRTILATLAPYTAFALIVVFQSDIRRVLARIGRRRFLGLGKLKRSEVAHDILLALAELSHSSTGALIVIERSIGLRTFIESGVNLDACLSRDLLLAIFQDRAALHDGAAILHGDRVMAAGCFLPLTLNPALASNLGTRHRAAIGVTEESDCLALVVSEETGRISVASGGEIQLDVPIERIREILTHAPAAPGVPQPFHPEVAVAAKSGSRHA